MRHVYLGLASIVAHIILEGGSQPNDGGDLGWLPTPMTERDGE